MIFGLAIFMLGHQQYEHITQDSPEKNSKWVYREIYIRGNLLQELIHKIMDAKKSHDLLSAN